MDNLPFTLVFWVLTVQLLFSFGVLCACSFVGEDAHNTRLYAGGLLTISGFAAGLSIWKAAGWIPYLHVWDGLLLTLTMDVVAFSLLHVLLPRHS
ncbi:uncharacterized protein AB9W97_021841 isoform 2-T2 [Spinachia spinachia]